MNIRYPRTRLFLLCCVVFLFSISVLFKFPPFTLLAGLYVLVAVLVEDIDPLFDKVSDDYAQAS